MTASTVLNTASGDRLTLILESLARPKKASPAQAADGLTYWQTVRLMDAMDTWNATEAAQEFLALRDRFGVTVGLTAAEDDVLGNAFWSAWDPNAVYFYRARFDFGAIRATTPPYVQAAVSRALAALQEDAWSGMMWIFAADDLWEKAAEKAAERELAALLPVGDMFGSGAWDKYVKTLSQQFSSHGEAIDDLDAAFNWSVVQLREFIFHEGRLDGEAFASGEGTR